MHWQPSRTPDPHIRRGASALNCTGPTAIATINHNIHYAQSSATLKRRATAWYTEKGSDLDLLRQVAKVSAQEAAECLGLDEQTYRQKEANRALPALFVDYLALKSGDLGRLSKGWSGWVFANDRLFPPDYATGFDPVHILNIHWLQEINAALRGRLRGLGQEVPDEFYGPAAGSPAYGQTSSAGRKEKPVYKEGGRHAGSPSEIGRATAPAQARSLALLKQPIEACGASLHPGGSPSLARQEKRRTAPSATVRHQQGQRSAEGTVSGSTEILLKNEPHTSGSGVVTKALFPTPPDEVHELRTHLSRQATAPEKKPSLVRRPKVRHMPASDVPNHELLHVHSNFAARSDRSCTASGLDGWSYTPRKTLAPSCGPKTDSTSVPGTLIDAPSSLTNVGLLNEPDRNESSTRIAAKSGTPPTSLSTASQKIFALPKGRAGIESNYSSIHYAHLSRG